MIGHYAVVAEGENDEFRRTGLSSFVKVAAVVAAFIATTVARGIYIGMSVTFAVGFAIAYLALMAAIVLGYLAYDRWRNGPSTAASDEHRARRHALPAGGHAVVVMRPKLVWRVAAVAFACALLVLAVAWSDWIVAATSILVTGTAIGSLRSFVCVEDWVIYRRTLLRWSEPMLLEKVTSVSLEPRWGPPLDRHVELWLHARDRTSMVFELRWWSNADALIRVVALAVADAVPDQPTQRQWSVELSSESQKRLSAFL